MTPDDCLMRKTRAALLIFAVLIFFFSGCGKKGPPVPPAHVPPPVVEGLSVQMSQNIAVLTWAMPDAKPSSGNRVAGFYIYQIKTPIEGTYKCPNCPQQFERIADIRILDTGDPAVFEMPLEKGFNYSFAVSAYTESGEEGERSTAVMVTY